MLGCAALAASGTAWAESVDATVSDWEGYADGTRHGLNVTVAEPETYTVSWSLSGAGPYSTELPDTSAAGDYLLYYQIEAAGYDTVSGSGQVLVHDDDYVPANKYRLSENGGAWEGMATLSNALERTQTAEGGNVTFVIELMAREDTWDKEMKIGRKGAQNAGSITIRSSSKSGQTYTLRRTASGACFYIQQYYTTALPDSHYVLFEHICFDGGAVWTNPDAYSDTANTGVGAGNLFITGVQSRLRIVFGDGCLMRNFQVGAASSGLIVKLYLSSEVRIIFEAGSRIEDCRGGNIVYLQRHQDILLFDGGVITRCGGNANGLLYFANAVSGTATNVGRRIFVSGAITNNQALGKGAVYSTISAANGVDFYPVEIAGDMTIDGNVIMPGGQAANVYYDLDKAQLLLADDVDSDNARVGVTYPGAAAKGDVFGLAAPGVVAKSAYVFHPDNGLNLLGNIDAVNGTLVWGSPFLKGTMISVH